MWPFDIWCSCMKLVFDITKMPLNYIIIIIALRTWTNFHRLLSYNSYRINLNSEYSTTSGDFSRKRRVLSFSLLNPLLFSITLYTTLSALLLYYYYYCEYWMLDHITRLYAVDMCTNWVVLGSFIIESEQKYFRNEKFTVKLEEYKDITVLKPCTYKFCY